MASKDNYDESQGNRPKEEEEAEEKTDGWMTTYADLVTLLLTFFVLMFALSNVSEEKFALIFTSINENGLSFERFEEIVNMYSQAPDEDDPGEYPVLPPPDDPSEGDLSHELEALYFAIQGYIDDNDLGNDIAVSYDGDFLLITLSSDIVFPSGYANITEEMELVAIELAQLINIKHTTENPFEIIVAGHTDNVPVSIMWRDNRQLSMARASNFLDVLLMQSTISPAYFLACGLGEEHPIDTNETAEGRQKNRRVEVLISPVRLSDPNRFRNAD